MNAKLNQVGFVKCTLINVVIESSIFGSFTLENSTIKSLSCYGIFSQRMKLIGNSITFLLVIASSIFRFSMISNAIRECRMRELSINLFVVSGNTLFKDGVDNYCVEFRLENSFIKTYRILDTLFDDDLIYHHRYTSINELNIIPTMQNVSIVINNATNCFRDRLINGVKLDKDLIGYKMIGVDGEDGVDYTIAKLRIPKGSIVFSNNMYKCRTNKAEVLEIEGYDKNKEYYSIYNISFKYHIGDVYEIDDFSYNHTLECAQGIHFFLTREEALNYM